MSEGKMSADLIERLRGVVRIPITDGMGPAGGEEPNNADFFVRTFPTSPLAMEAADHIATIQREADGMREALTAHEKRTAFMRKISPHVAAMLDEYDAPVAAVLAEGCGSPQVPAAEGSE